MNIELFSVIFSFSFFGCLAGETGICSPAVEIRSCAGFQPFCKDTKVIVIKYPGASFDVPEAVVSCGAIGWNGFPDKRMYLCNMDKQIFRLAIPNIISNITVPLLGMVDLAIAGHLDSSLYIGAIALGVTVFNLIYWNFGFLRMSTSGFTSQALGARNPAECMHVLLRSLIGAGAIGLLILCLQYPIGQIAFRLMHPGERMQFYVEVYFRICVWGAPAVLMMYVFNGWFVGMQNTKTPMFIALFNNLLNMLLSFTFVYLFDMDVDGIALGTALSQLVTLSLTIAVWFRLYGRLRKYIRREAIFERKALRLLFSVNGDVFIRTFLLTAVTAFFTFSSTRMGDLILAVNTLLMQFFMLFSYFMDGFAYAGEALTGKFIGAGRNDLLRKMLRRLFFWGGVVSVFTSVIYLTFSKPLLQLLTDKAEVIVGASDYRFWTVLIPIAGFAAFLWDGVFVGATASKEMRNAMILSTVTFAGCYFLTISWMGNNGLWLAFILYLLLRSVSQTFLAKKALFIYSS